MANINQIDYSDYAFKILPHLVRDYEFETKDGDFKIGDTLEQDSYLIVEGNTGIFYFSPYLGVGIKKKQNATININSLKRSITQQLVSAGIKVNNVYIINSDTVRELSITDTDILAKVEEDGYVIALDIE